MRQSAIGFYSKKLELEGIIATPQDPGANGVPAVIACHSHPMLGGNMNDPIVAAVCQAVVREGMVALRFNFRGVGDSQGDFTNGKEEHNDVKSALNVMRHWPSVHGGRVAIDGYSTGATIVLDGLQAPEAGLLSGTNSTDARRTQEQKIQQGQAPSSGNSGFGGSRLAVA